MEDPLNEDFFYVWYNKYNNLPCCPLADILTDIYFQISLRSRSYNATTEQKGYATDFTQGNQQMLTSLLLL